MLELYHNDMSVCAQKVRMALAEKGLEWTGHHLNLRRGDQLEPAYARLNPNNVVPTLVHDGTVVIESTVINEYIDDAFPETPLKPADAAGRARMRLWTKQLDEGVHAATGNISMSIAFRFQYPEATIERILKTRTGERLERFKNILKGIDSPAIPGSVARFDRLLSDMEAALADGPWLAGEAFSLADIGYAPYLTRLDHLRFLAMLDRRPRLAGWYERIKARPSYQAGLAAHFNPDYLPLMEEKGREAWPVVKALLDAA